MKVHLQVCRALRASVPRSLQRTLVRKLAAAGRRIGLASGSSITVRIADDEEVARLHEEFMGLPGPTDVLSFPSEDDEGSLGDLVIGWPFAVRQCASRGYGPAAWETELVDLSLHGLAHLLGHDHATRPQARAMYRLELRLARRASMPRPQRPYT